MASAPDQSLGTRTMRGMFWACGAYVGGRAIVLVSTAILARLLTPKDFGVVALALVFMTFMETIQDLGLTQALIVSSDEETPARAQTTFV
jgi:PST family polysaccharide transporter